LELVNRRPTPRSTLDGEIPVVAGLDPDAGWQMWQGAPDAWPVTVLPAMEAVQAAKEQSPRASEALDRALRLALFAESRCISLHHVILEVASETPEVDADEIERALVSGRARSRIFDDFAVSQTDQIKGSPHVFVQGGTDAHNPGVEMKMHGKHGKGGYPRITKDDPSIYETMMMEA
jgi:predicted DsbA family dithiol-disulfide isomerase